MKKIISFSFWVVLLFLFAGWGCTTVPIPGYTEGKTLAVFPETGTNLKISNLEMPTTVKGREFFPISFNYETDGTPVAKVFAICLWRHGEEKIQLQHQKLEKGKSTGRMRLATNTARSVEILIYVEDGEGNKSNTLRHKMILIN